MLSDLETETANGIGLIAITNFKRRCEQAADMPLAGKLVLQRMYDDVSRELSPGRGK